MHVCEPPRCICERRSRLVDAKVRFGGAATRLGDVRTRVGHAPTPVGHDQTRVTHERTLLTHDRMALGHDRTRLGHDETRIGGRPTCLSGSQRRACEDQTRVVGAATHLASVKLCNCVPQVRPLDAEGCVGELPMVFVDVEEASRRPAARIAAHQMRLARIQFRALTRSKPGSGAEERDRRTSKPGFRGPKRVRGTELRIARRTETAKRPRPLHPSGMGRYRCASMPVARSVSMSATSTPRSP
jgi:hypothetical protein